MRVRGRAVRAVAVADRRRPGGRPCAARRRLVAAPAARRLLRAGWPWTPAGTTGQGRSAAIRRLDPLGLGPRLSRRQGPICVPARRGTLWGNSFPTPGAAGVCRYRCEDRVQAPPLVRVV